MKQLLLKAALVCTFVFALVTAGLQAQIYSYTSATNGAANSVAANATGTSLSRVNGANTPGTPCGTGFSVTNYSSTTTFSTGLAAVEFTVTPNSGYKLNITGFSAGLRRSGSGPASARYAYSTDGGTTWIDQGSNQTPNNASCGTTTTGSWTFSLTVSSGNFKMRIYGFNASATSGTFQLLNATLNGTVAAICTVPTLSSSITNVTCNGGSDGAIDLTATGGTSPFTYAWTKSGGGFSASTEDISGLSAGTYNITLTANGGCTTSTSYTVTEPAALSPIVTTASTCDSYTWSVTGLTYTSGGTYNTTIGCQPYTLNLTITSSTSNTTAISACDSYTWPVDGNTYTSSGTYTNTVGCHTEILDLTITASTSNTTTVSTCDSYTWSVDGNTYTSSGTYTNTVGCHTEILDLTITASSANTTSITQCDSYTWSVNGQTYTSSGTYTDVSNCHTEVLDLTIIPSSTNVTSVTACNTYIWSVNGQTYTSSGTYLDVVGCHTEELDLTIVTGTAPAKPNPVSGQQFNLCNVSGDKTYSIATVPDATSYTWTAPAGTSIVSGNGTNSIVLNITSGFTDGQISVTADNLCGSSLPRTFFIHAKPSKPVISGPTCVSANQTNITYTVANAEAGVTYTWKVPGVVRIISGQGTSSIVVDWRSTNGAIQCVPSNACATGAKGALNVAVGCTATASSSSQKLLVNPNPSFGLTNIIFTSVKEIKYKLVLTDMSGRQLMAKELMASAGQNKISIDLSKYDNGIYMVSLISDEGVETTKIVKGQ